MEKLKVILSDPQVLFREGIHFILSGEDEFEVTGETTGNEDVLNLIETNPPDIVFLSMQDKKLNGPEATRHIKRSLPPVSVILITDRKDESLLFDAIKSGASACLTKDTDPDNLLDTIKTVADGNNPIIEDLMIPGLASMVLAEFDDMTEVNEKLDGLLAKLSPRETLVLNNIIDGDNIEQLAYKIDSDESTVRNILGTIMDKLVSNDHARTLIKAAQKNLPAAARRNTGKDDNASEYVTKAEFSEFKESLTERVKSLFGELGDKVFHHD